MDLISLGFREWQEEKKQLLLEKSTDGTVVARAFCPTTDGAPDLIRQLADDLTEQLRQRIFPSALSAWEQAKQAGVTRAAYRVPDYRVSLYSRTAAPYTTWLFCVQTRRGGDLLRFYTRTVTLTGSFSGPLPYSFFAAGKSSALFTVTEQAIYPLKSLFSGACPLPASSAAEILLRAGDPVPLRRLPATPPSKKTKKREKSP